MNLVDTIANCLHKRILKVRWRVLHERFKEPGNRRRVMVWKGVLRCVNTVLDLTERVVYRDHYRYLKAWETIIEISKKGNLWTRNNGR